MEDIEDYYRDYAWENTRFLPVKIFSSWTPYGIKCIDSEYGRRIRNICKPVLRIIQVDRTDHNCLNGWWDDYTEIPLDKDYKTYDRTVFIYNEGEIYTELKDKRNDYQKSKNIPYQQFQIIEKDFTYTHPIYSVKHKGEDPEVLRKEIDDNPHLHYKIKENLLGNLKRVLEERNGDEFN